MSKDAYYFSHDSNAKDDPKCVLLIEQLGLEGYGIYWVLIEILRDQPNYRYPIALIPSIARRYNTTTEKVKTVLTAYTLFAIENDEFFYSESLDNRMKIREAISEKRRNSAITRWGDANALQLHSNSSAIAMQGKERKGKERKENKGKENKLFDTFYSAYPRKINKADAIKAFASLNVSETLLTLILEGLAKWKKQESWTRDEGKYIPYPATWLRRRSWEDEISTPVYNNPVRTSGGTYKI